MIDTTPPRDILDRDKDDDEQRREEHSAAIDVVLMRLVRRVLQEVQEARDAQESGEPQDPTAPLDHMIDVLDDLIDARQELDRLYTAIHGATDDEHTALDVDDLRDADDVDTLDAQDLDELATLDADAPPSGQDDDEHPKRPHLPTAPSPATLEGRPA